MTGVDPGPLTEVQREIMEVIWSRQEATVSDVLNVLAARRDVARNTVQTMMVRLEEKGWLQHREEGRAFLYSAARPKSTSLGAKVAQMVDRLFSGAAEEMVTALIEYRGLSEEEGRRIRDMIDRAESKPAQATKKSPSQKLGRNKKEGK